jgi:isoleucyl-tRNA synthetase
MKAGAQMIQEMDQKSITELEKTDQYIIEIDGDRYMLSNEDVEISFDEIPGWQVAIDKDITVALDISLSDELIAEGVARELVNRIQNIRKTSDFNVTDKITIEIENHEIIRDAVSHFGEYIKAEVLGTSISLGEATKGESVEITEELSLRIQIQRV